MPSAPPTAPPSRGARAVVTWWGLGGVLLLLGRATLGLGRRGVATIAAGLTTAEWLVLLALTAFFLYTEGVLALQRRWVPRVVARASSLREDPRTAHIALAPLHAMGLVGAPRREAIRTWAGVIAIVAMVLVVRAFPEPWRGIVDFAVAAALAWACGALVVQAVRTFR